MRLLNNAASIKWSRICDAQKQASVTFFLQKMQDTPYLLAPSYRRNMLSGVLGIKPQIGFNRNLDQLRSQELPPRHLNQC